MSLAWKDWRDDPKPVFRWDLPEPEHPDYVTGQGVIKDGEEVEITATYEGKKETKKRYVVSMPHPKTQELLDQEKIPMNREGRRKAAKVLKKFIRKLEQRRK